MLVATGSVLWFVPSDHYVFLPDPARNVDSLVLVPDEDRGNEGGGIFMVDILVRKASLFERIFPRVNGDATLVPASEFNPEGLNEGQRRRQSLSQMTVSQQVAIAVALRELGHDVRPRGAEIVQVQPDSPAAAKLKVDDVIVEAKGTEIAGPDDLFAIMERQEPGRPVAVTVERDGRARELRVGTRPAPGAREGAVMGVLVQPEFRFPVNVRIDAGNVGGPSAGLAFALEIVDELGRDLDGGRRIAATGEIDLDGEVFAIGGIKQKTIGARRADVDVFVVPDENATEARRYAEGLEIVAVSSFDDALTALATR